MTPKVLFIAGYGRSGSTLLDRMLGQLDGFFSSGELWRIWDAVANGTTICGCGAEVARCEVWSGVVEKVLAGATEEPRTIFDTQLAIAPLKRLPHVLWKDTSPRRDSLRQVTASLYRAIAEETGARVVIDSSKLPSLGALTGAMEEVETYVLHLVRDPRAVSYSQLRHKPRPVGRPLAIRSPGRSSIHWVAHNMGVSLTKPRVRRYLRIRYEDFMAAPLEAIGRITRWLGEERPAPAYLEKERVQLAVAHTVDGNPSRFNTGWVPFRPDDEWLTRQRPRDRAVVTSISLPLLARYGYPLRVRARRGAQDPTDGTRRESLRS